MIQHPNQEVVLHEFYITVVHFMTFLIDFCLPWSRHSGECYLKLHIVNHWF